MSFTQLDFDSSGSASTFIEGKAGDIEVLVTRPAKLSEQTPVVIISHPHPLYGGTMTNKVVTILAKTFAEINAITVRYNFRGAGQSEGEHDQGIGESADLSMLAEELRQWRPAAPLWLAGFSFGAYVTLRAQAAINPDKVILVAPPVSMYSFDELDEVTVSWIVIQGGQDEVIDALSVKSWVNERPEQPGLIWMEEAGHFFHGKLIELKEQLLERLA